MAINDNSFFRNPNPGMLIKASKDPNIKKIENDLMEKLGLKTQISNKKNNKGKIIVRKLFDKIKQNPKKFISREQFFDNKYRSISDFISGMTDRYAVNLYENLK